MERDASVTARDNKEIPIPKISRKKMAAGTVLPMPIAGTGSTAGVRGVEDPEGKRGFHEKAGTQNGIPADDL